jgi:dodecin
VILLIGSSKESWEKAAANAVEQASKSLRDLRVAEIVELDMQLDAKGWKPIARRSGYRSKSSAEDQINACSTLASAMPAFVGILSAHVALQLVDWRCLRSPHDVKRDGLMRVAAKAFHFEIAISRVDRVAQRRRWLRRSLTPSMRCIKGRLF